MGGILQFRVEVAAGADRKLALAEMLDVATRVGVTVVAQWSTGTQLRAVPGQRIDEAMDACQVVFDHSALDRGDCVFRSGRTSCALVLKARESWCRSCQARAAGPPPDDRMKAPWDSSRSLGLTTPEEPCVRGPATPPSPAEPACVTPTPAGILETLESEDFRRSLHRWVEGQTQRSRTDDVTDLLGEIAARLRAAFSPPEVLTEFECPKCHKVSETNLLRPRVVSCSCGYVAPTAPPAKGEG